MKRVRVLAACLAILLPPCGAVGDDTLSKALPGPALFSACQGCHSLQKGEPHKTGPNLHGIVGRPSATRQGYAYSPALREAGIVWDRNALIAWIVATESMAPGTWMLYQNHLTPPEIMGLADYIIEQTRQEPAK